MVGAAAGYNQLYVTGRAPGPILEAACWAHARRPFFALADIEAGARRKAEGKAPAPISPLALEAVRRIDALFEIERAINGRTAQERQVVRQEVSAPLVAELEAWMRKERPKLSSEQALADISAGSRCEDLNDEHAAAAVPARTRQDARSLTGSRCVADHPLYQYWPASQPLCWLSN
jgi:hypothetical protein